MNSSIDVIININIKTDVNVNIHIYIYIYIFHSLKKMSFLIILKHLRIRIQS